jgi:hypothetical protein
MVNDLLRFFDGQFLKWIRKRLQGGISFFVK